MTNLPKIVVCRYCGCITNKKNIYNNRNLCGDCRLKYQKVNRLITSKKKGGIDIVIFLEETINFFKLNNSYEDRIKDVEYSEYVRLLEKEILNSKKVNKYH